jgi:hypothetical protein
VRIQKLFDGTLIDLDEVVLVFACSGDPDWLRYTVRFRQGHEVEVYETRQYAEDKALPQFPREELISLFVNTENSRIDMTTNVDKYFAYEHLPEKLQAISKPIAELSQLMNDMLPDGAEKSAGMRKLLEAKDCFVRSALP